MKSIKRTRRCKRFDKKWAELIHAKKRFHARLRIVYDKQAREDMLKMINDGTAPLVMQQTNRLYIHDMEYQGKSFQVVYDRKRRSIVTCLIPGQTFEEYD